MEECALFHNLVSCEYTSDASPLVASLFQCGKTRTGPWHNREECEMEMVSLSDSVSYQLTADL